MPVVVDLWAPWCGPCRMISPTLEDVATRLRGQLKLVKVNVDDNPGVSARFGVQGIPTLLLFHDGALIDRAVGARGANSSSPGSKAHSRRASHRTRTRFGSVASMRWACSVHGYTRSGGQSGWGESGSRRRSSGWCC